MRYPVMRIMVSFANEGIRMADLDTRKELVKALYRFLKMFLKRMTKYYSEKAKNIVGSLKSGNTVFF